MKEFDCEEGRGTLDEGLAKKNVRASRWTRSGFGVILLLSYAAFLYMLCDMLRFGGISHRLPACVMLFAVVVALAGLIIIFWIKCKKNTKKLDRVFLKSTKFRIAQILFVALLLLLTVGAGTQIYKSGTNYNGKLFWWLDSFMNEKKVAIAHKNIYEDGIDGIIADIRKKVSMPETLYMSGDFSLKFQPDGRITGFNFGVYGKNKKNQTQGYLIEYDRSQDKMITVYANSYEGEDYTETNNLQVLQDTVNAVFYNRPFEEWKVLNPTYELRYYGERNWGYNTDGIIYIDKNQQEKEAGVSYAEIKGCSLSVTYAGHDENNTQKEYMPHRYILVDDINHIEVESANSSLVQQAKEDQMQETKKTQAATESFVSDSTGYRLRVVDAAAGNRFYNLNKTVNGGDDWQLINEDPFHGQGGSDAKVQFIDENLGFLFFKHSAGANGEVDITTDGGKTVTQLKLNLPEINLGGEMYQVYDTPESVIQQEDKLVLEVGQGTDGDYNGGDSIYFTSTDRGKTWIQQDGIVNSIK